MFLDHLERAAGVVEDHVVRQAVWLHAVPVSVEDLVREGISSRVLQVVQAFRSCSASARVMRDVASVRAALQADHRFVAPKGDADPLAGHGYQIQCAIGGLRDQSSDLGTPAVAAMVEHWWESSDDWTASVAVYAARGAGLLDRERLLRKVADGAPGTTAAIAVLSGEGDEREAEVLRAVLLRQGEDWHWARLAASARLAEIGGPGTPEWVLGHPMGVPWRYDRAWLHRNAERLTPLLIEALPDPLWWHEASVALASLRAAEAVGPLCESVHTAEEPVRQIEALGTIGSPEAGPTLEALCEHESEDVRAAALQALGHTGGADVVAVALKACDDPYAWVRYRAIQLLTRHADERAVTTLIRLSDTDHAALAADALARIGDPRALPVLWNLFAHHHDRAVRHAAGRGLARIEGEQWGVSMSDPHVARAYMWLVGYKPEWSRGPLEDGTKHSDAMVRVRAAEAFGRLRDPAGVEHVRPLLTDPDSRVRAAARSVIGFLEGLTLP
ncbi:hypothetical protein GCM10011609_56470 [Lentzea pudingi]|uniref:HEAT repeat n=1 Tax=Lentzea pudingi TaxID=1789439 RepID=A0ABQ2IHU8_9PSEU|nr:hypothetical protein GCM10011609_56470 [Lentzea pudingi]